MDRRSFLKNSIASGAAALVASSLPGSKALAGLAGSEADIAVVNGIDYLSNTQKAVQILGGIGKFVHPGSRVGLLINSAFELQGAYVHPDISLAVLKMCFEAGANEVVLLQAVDEAYWTRSSHHEDMKEMFGKVSQVASNVFPAEFNEEDWKLLPAINGAKALKEVEVIRELEQVDVLINVFIAKHHAGTFYTGALKNSMGFCTRKTNVFYHLGSGERNDPDFLAQSIADINLLRQPDLIIGDATSFILTNGPSGPGEVKTLNKVFAGTNLVAMDALGATYNDLEPGEVLTNVKAAEMGLGSYELDNIRLVEIA
jgi:uncharacterized protein (DUF362 family)